MTLLNRLNFNQLTWLESFARRDDRMSNATKNLKFLKRRHELTGFDCDYLDKLNTEELEFMEGFAREFYEGSSDDAQQRKAGNRRRYSAKQADALRLAGELSPTVLVDDLNPEKLLCLLEATGTKVFKEEPPTHPVSALTSRHPKRRHLREASKTKH